MSLRDAARTNAVAATRGEYLIGTGLMSFFQTGLLSRAPPL